MILAESYDKLVGFSALEHIPALLNQPLLLIAGSKAITLGTSQQAYSMANGEDKELVIIDGATHIAMYDIPQYVDQAMAKLTEFFTRTLNR
jgi:fermentation-respiration switch protein FrsA (DUF1100 family)